MAFFEKLNKMAKVIEEKTNDSLELSKLTAKAGNAEIAFKKDIEKIGNFYYEFYMAGGTVEPNILATLQSAKANQDTMVQARADIEALNAEIEAKKEEAREERAAAREAAKAEREAARAAAKAEKEAAEAAAKAQAEAEAAAARADVEEAVETEITE